MALVLNGSANTISGLAVGGLPDGIVDADMIATDAVTAPKISTIGTILNYTQVESDTNTDLGSSTGGGGTWTTAPSPFDAITITTKKAGSNFKIVLYTSFYQDNADLDFGVTASYKIGSGSYTRLGHVGSTWDTGLFSGYFNPSGVALDYIWPVTIDYIHTPSSYSAGDVLTYKFEYWTNQDDCHWNGVRDGRCYARIEEVNV
jgi:hypothetical protein